MKILGIDTTSNILSVAVSEDDIILGENTIDNSTNHSPKLVPMIDELLNRLNIDISQIDMFACSIGPGSFTGIRIGLGLAKSMAQANDKLIVGIPTLLSLAKNVDMDDIDGYVCPLIAARNNNIYSCILDNKYNIVLDYAGLSIDELIEKCNTLDKPIYFLGNGAIIYKEKIQDNIASEKILDIIDSQLNAKNICVLGYDKFKNGQTDSIYSLSPTYLRPSSAERLCKNE